MSEHIENKMNLVNMFLFYARDGSVPLKINEHEPLIVHNIHIKAGFRVSNTSNAAIVELVRAGVMVLTLEPVPVAPILPIGFDTTLRVLKLLACQGRTEPSSRGTLIPCRKKSS